MYANLPYMVGWRSAYSQKSSMLRADPVEHLEYFGGGVEQDKFETWSNPLHCTSQSKHICGAFYSWRCMASCLINTAWVLSLQQKHTGGTQLISDGRPGQRVLLSSCISSTKLMTRKYTESCCIYTCCLSAVNFSLQLGLDSFQSFWRRWMNY